VGFFDRSLAEMNPEFEASDRQLVIGHQSRSPNPLAIDARAIGAAQVAQEQHAVCLNDDAMHLRDALVIQAQITFFFAAHQGQVFDDLDRRCSIQGHKLGPHRKS
jgi:hypothetical protein